MPTSRPKRRPSRRLGAALAAAGALALVLTGCVGGPAPTSTPTPTAAAPIFASDEEALAAAVKAYDNYRVASAEIAREGGSNPERIDTVVSPEYAPVLHKEFAQLADAGLRLIGPSSIDTTSLVSWDETDERVETAIYLCRDVTNVQIVNAAGEDVTPVDRQDRLPTQAFLISSESDPSLLVVDRVELWSGDDFC